MRSKQVRIGVNFLSAAVAGACLSVGLAGAVRGAVVTPSPTYTVDFNTGGSDAADFASYPKGLAPSVNTWTVTGGVWQHEFTGTDGGSYVGELVGTSGVAGSNFTVSTDFTLTERHVAGNNYLFGLAALTNGDLAPWDGGASWYAASIRLSNDGSNDQLSIAQDDGAWGSDLPGTTAQPLGFTIANGTKYHLSVTGTYDGLGQLVLSTTVVDTTNPSNTATLTSSALPSPRTGTYFGYADDGFWGDGGTINYDNFTLSTVPEPASIGLLALGAVGLLARRRQKA